MSAVTTGTSADPDICREFADGVHWVGSCLIVRSVDPNIHSHLSAYVVQGTKGTVMIDTGHPKDWSRVQRHVEDIAGPQGLTHIFPTHQEYPHSGNLRDLLRAHPDAVAFGNVQDYHAYIPDVRDRLVPRGPGWQLDLGDRQLVVLPALLRDLPSTLWAYDTKAQVLFVSDGFSYSHQHVAGECDRLSTELSQRPSEADIKFINETALHWSKFVDCTPIFEEIERMTGQYPVRFIAPAHGNVIDDPDAVLPLMRSIMCGGR